MQMMQKLHGEGRTGCPRVAGRFTILGKGARGQEGTLILSLAPSEGLKLPAVCLLCAGPSACGSEGGYGRGRR